MTAAYRARCSLDDDGRGHAQGDGGQAAGWRCRTGAAGGSIPAQRVLRRLATGGSPQAATMRALVARIEGYQTGARQWLVDVAESVLDHEARRARTGVENGQDEQGPRTSRRSGTTGPSPSRRPGSARRDVGPCPRRTPVRSAGAVEEGLLADGVGEGLHARRRSSGKSPIRRSSRWRRQRAWLRRLRRGCSWRRYERRAAARRRR